MCRLQCLQDRIDDDEGLLGRERPVLAHDITQGSSLNELHRQVHDFAVCALIKYANDMWVMQPCGGTRLSLKTLNEIWVGRQVCVHDFQCDDSIKPQIRSLIHGRHTASRQFRVNAVAAVHHGADEIVEGSHFVSVWRNCGHSGQPHAHRWPGYC